MNHAEELLASLSHEKRLLLESRLLGEKLSAKKRALPETRNQPAPLSFGQESLWLFDQMDCSRHAYNLPQAFRLRGPIQIDALRKAFETVIARHESLRTNFVLVDAQPIQVVTSEKSFPLPVLDFSRLSEQERASAVARHLEAEAQRDFDLSHDLLLRAALLRLADDEHVLFICMHHIVSDDASLSLLHQELGIAYENFCAGKTPSLPELTLQYSDFARRQREQLHSPTMARQIAYWKERLEGELPSLELPADRPRVATRTFQGGRETFQFSSALLPELRELSRREKVTVHVATLAAFQVLLQRYTRENDLVVGCPIGTRIQRELQALIGFFVNTVPLRSDLSGNPSFVELLRQVHGQMLGALANQEIFMEQLAHELQLPRHPGRNPLFQTVFQYLPTPVHSLALRDLSVEFIPVSTCAAHFDFTLTLRGEGQHLSGEVDYSTDLFDAATIQRMLGHYQNLLESVIANPDRKISSLRLLAKSEEHQLLFEWNSPEISRTESVRVHQLFEAQAARVPDGIAVRCGSEEWSYAELNRRANQLAGFLEKKGVGAETCVGLLFERSPEMVLAILAVLKCGAAYVPLDPHYPEDRLAFMLTETRAAPVLTNRSFLKNLPDHRGKTICLDSDWATIADENAKNPARLVPPENLAYVIFTSGSTGRPKGVEVTHGNLAHSIAARLAHYLEPVRNVLLSFSFAFDGSVAGMFWALCTGGALTIPVEALYNDVTELVRLIQETHVSHAICLPSFYNLMLEHAERLRSLDTVIVAGEACGISLVQKHAEKLPDVALFNEYGPTEATVWSTVDQLHPNFSGKISIGKPIRDARIYILDAERNPVPIGVAGEIYIGGAGVVRGYLNNPELTREKFIPDPFSSQPQAHLYRTGDLARFLADGKIDFLGRIDDQVKVRGYRIELGEIETVLREHPAISEVAVLAGEDSSGEKSLTAYVASPSFTTTKIQELRYFLKSKLPDYMIPSAFVILEKLPLHPNGKLNRKALPAAESAPRQTAFVAPRTPVEKQIAEIWAELLKINPVGVHDNFFDLGGHSLLATQVVSRMRSLKQGEVTLREFFGAPTIAGLSALHRKSDDANPAPATILPLARKTPSQLQTSRL